MNRKTGIIIGITMVVILGVAIVLAIIFQPIDKKVDLTSGQKQSMEIGGEEADKLAAEELKEFPILKHIPYVMDKYSDDMTVYTHYEIWPEYSDNKLTIVIRDYTGGNEQAAKDIMKGWGIDLSQYKIVYNNLSSEYGSVRVPDD